MSRKTAKQILEEIILEQELDKLSPYDRGLFDGYVDSLCNFKINELDALEGLARFADRSEELAKHVRNIIVGHSRTILAKMNNMTMDQLDQQIKEIQKEADTFERRKNEQSN